MMTTTRLLLALSLLGAAASVGCSAETSTTPAGKSADELSLWKNPDGSVSTTPPHQVGAEVGVGMPGLMCSSFSELALAAETQCRRQGLALIALKPDGFCSSYVDYGVPVGTEPSPGWADGSEGGQTREAPKPMPEPLPTDPVPPQPGPGPIPGPVPAYWGFDHAIGVCGYGPTPPEPPRPCNEKECPPPPCDYTTYPANGNAACPPPPCEKPGDWGCPVEPPKCPEGAVCEDPRPLPLPDKPNG